MILSILITVITASNPINSKSHTKVPSLHDGTHPAFLQKSMFAYFAFNPHPDVFNIEQTSNLPVLSVDQGLFEDSHDLL